MASYETLFSKNLRRLRKSAGMTQKELGESTGYSEKTISKWECAASIPDIGGLFALSRKLGVTVEELFSMVLNQVIFPPILWQDSLFSTFCLQYFLFVDFLMRIILTSME